MARGAVWGVERDRLTELGKAPLTPAQKQLVEEYMSQWPYPIAVLYKAYPYMYGYVRSTDLEPEDVCQICWIGVFRAARTWNPEHDSKANFATYAASKMRGELGRAIRLQKSASRTCPGMTYLDAFEFRFLHKKHDQKEILPVRRDEVDKLRKAIARMKPTVQEILAMRYGMNGPEMTLEAIGKLKGITRERVRQIQASAIKQLRKHFRAEA